MSVQLGSTVRTLPWLGQHIPRGDRHQHAVERSNGAEGREGGGSVLSVRAEKESRTTGRHHGTRKIHTGVLLARSTVTGLTFWDSRKLGGHVAVIFLALK